MRTGLLNLALVLGFAATLIGCSDQAAPPPPAAVATETADQPPQAVPFVPSLEVVPDDFEPEADFTTLALEDFTPFAGDADTWQEIDGVVVCSGRPKGYVYSKVPYGNFTWRAEYRFAPVQDETKRARANTGFMVHIQPPHKVWPRSLEVQGRWDEMASINANGGAAKCVVGDDRDAREAARRPVGEWNAVEIVSRNGALTATLNGELICISQPGELTAGSIGLQSELFEVHFRRLRIRVDP